MKTVDKKEKGGKTSTGIEGLDEIFYGGIVIDKEEGERSLLILARGEHGVNKIHLAMQMCEGMFCVEHKKYAPLTKKDDAGGGGKKILFISLNKDTSLVENLYYDFYIQRLIRYVREDNEQSKKALKNILEISWKNNSQNEVEIDDELKNVFALPVPEKKLFFKECLQRGVIYYNELTHGVHVRSMKGRVDKLLCTRGRKTEHSCVEIVGVDKLPEVNLRADGVTLFMKMMDKLSDYGKGELDYIMIDGLSRLSKDELLQCPLNALADELRKKANQAAIITADEKLASSYINVDIVIDMAIKQRDYSDQQYNALKISKCLYQKNAYGWHNYKMRAAGIEVIPSLHLQLKTRFLMYDAVSDANLPYNVYPYPAWLNELQSLGSEGENAAYIEYKKIIEDKETDNPKYKMESEGALCLLNTRNENEFRKDVCNDTTDKYLFIGLRDNRNACCKEIEEKYGKDEQKTGKYHLFCFEPGYIHADEFLWTIDRMVKALARPGENDNKKLYSKVHLVFGDFQYINYAYPCLKKEGLFLPALYQYTHKHHMRNYIRFSEPQLKRDASTCHFNMRNYSNPKLAHPLSCVSTNHFNMRNYSRFAESQYWYREMGEEWALYQQIHSIVDDFVPPTFKH